MAGASEGVGGCGSECKRGRECRRRFGQCDGDGAEWRRRRYCTKECGLACEEGQLSRRGVGVHVGIGAVGVKMCRASRCCRDRVGGCTGANRQRDDKEEKRREEKSQPSDGPAASRQRVRRVWYDDDDGTTTERQRATTGDRRSSLHSRWEGRGQSVRPRHLRRRASPGRPAVSAAARNWLGTHAWMIM